LWFCKPKPNCPYAKAQSGSHKFVVTHKDACLPPKDHEKTGVVDLILMLLLSTGVIAVLIVLDALITKNAPWLKSPDE
jgi:uncharacterized membrane protein